ncbi:MAG: GMP synthase subunit A [Candidatus Micrarchaeia archaeon]
MIAVIDNGGQYTHVIWRSVRDLGFEAKIFPKETPFASLPTPKAFVLSGGPGSAYKDEFYVNKDIILGAARGILTQPVLGICQGHQLIAHYLGGKVGRGESAEYGIGRIAVDEPDLLFKGLPSSFNAWVSHFDEVKRLPPDFVSLAHSATCRIEAMKHKSRPLFGVQFHPEVWHTEGGERILANFLSLAR